MSKISKKNLQLSDEENKILSHRNLNYNDTTKNSQTNKDNAFKKYASPSISRTNDKIENNDLISTEKKMKINEYLANHTELLETDPNEEDEDITEIEHDQNYYPDIHARTAPE